jgi:hypothetical protein
VADRNVSFPLSMLATSLHTHPTNALSPATLRRAERPSVHALVEVRSP